MQMAYKLYHKKAFEKPKFSFEMNTFEYSVMCKKATHLVLITFKRNL